MNPPIKPPLVDGVLYIDNSSMELFTTCPRQAYYYIIRRLELNKDKIALDFGNAFHCVLEYLYKKYGNSYRSQADNQDVINFAVSTISSLPVDPNELQDFHAARQLRTVQGLLNPPILITPQDDYRTVSYLVSGVEKYLRDHPAEVWSIATLPNGAPAVEVPFAMPIGTIDTASWGKVTIIWTGKIDLVYRSNGTLGLLDHKTTSMMGPQFFTEFEFAHQMYGYNAAVEHIFNEPCTAITINGLGCRKPSRTGTQFEFNRHTIPISRPLLDEWHTDSLALVSDFLAHCERGYFPKATKWCVGKYGACQYRAVCSMAPQHRELALSTSEFRPVTWSPLTAKP